MGRKRNAAAEQAGRIHSFTTHLTPNFGVARRDAPPLPVIGASSGHSVLEATNKPWTPPNDLPPNLPILPPLTSPNPWPVRAVDLATAVTHSGEAVRRKKKVAPYRGPVPLPSCSTPYAPLGSGPYDRYRNTLGDRNPQAPPTDLDTEVDGINMQMFSTLSAMKN
eukprot:gene9822-254_t